MADATSLWGIPISPPGPNTFTPEPMPSGDTADGVGLFYNPETNQLDWLQAHLDFGPSAMTADVALPAGQWALLADAPAAPYGFRSQMVSYPPRGTWVLHGQLIVYGPSNMTYWVKVMQGTQPDPTWANLLTQAPVLVGAGVSSYGGAASLPVAIPFSADFTVNAQRGQAAEILVYCMAQQGPATADSASGVEIKTGDPSRTLVGMVYMAAGTPGTFSDAIGTRFVASWFNRRLRIARGSLQAGPYTTTSATYVEVASAGRAEFLTWDADIFGSCGGGDFANNTLNAFVAGAAGLDGASTLSLGAGLGQDAVAANRFFWAAQVSFPGVSEGYHFITTCWRVNTGTGTLSSGGDPETTIVQAHLLI